MTPPFNDTGLITCNKWHIRGFCYEKCDRRGSHKKFESISHKTAFDSWVKALKNKAPWQLGPTGGGESSNSIVSFHKINCTEFSFPSCADASDPTFKRSFPPVTRVASVVPLPSSSSSNDLGSIVVPVPPRISKPIAGLPTKEDLLKNNQGKTKINQPHHLPTFHRLASTS